jgi:hypothetical protein
LVSVKFKTTVSEKQDCGQSGKICKVYKFEAEIRAVTGLPKLAKEFHRLIHGVSCLQDSWRGHDVIKGSWFSCFMFPLAPVSFV